jgi:hypothetical protein
MTEAEWLSSTDPIEMIEFLRGNPTSEDTVNWWNNRWQIDEPCEGNDRKFRLFSCACCRRVWNRIPEACNRDGVIAVEDFIDRKASGSALQASLVASSSVEYTEDGTKRSEPGYWIVKYLGRGFYKMTAAASALLVSSQVIFMADDEYGRMSGSEFHGCYYTAAGYFMKPFRWPLPIPATVEIERMTHADILRCAFGNPFRLPVSLDLSILHWNDGLIGKLTETIYQERAFDRLPVLADALEDAGCLDADLMNHCRKPGLHDRGCWALDSILAKK